MVRAARVWAGAHGRNYVLPDDVKQLAVPVWTHRLVMSPDAEFSGATAQQVIAKALAAIDAPQVKGVVA
jgi:MoxR-like ATPase